MCIQHVRGLGRRVPKAVQQHAVVAVHETVNQVLGQTIPEEFVARIVIRIVTLRPIRPNAHIMPEGNPVPVAQVTAQHYPACRVAGDAEGHLVLNRELLDDEIKQLHGQSEQKVKQRRAGHGRSWPGCGDGRRGHFLNVVA
ncbi:hypothetical protein PG988_006417 [Apiospora saccharicola]